ncbi:MAG: glycoside hydrolase family 16 protein [Flavobacterium sp.]|uniref:glycoside hydrolase family 16 protein n=1 Tax=Flavobacterium sp. TaxID=239 RepID=UPI0026116B75|nr:glycoside hydrolase family 16 protein [Flavobacterium sp.]MDD5150482.1 glycoside hydrolase family 16 protein [Flavobacterium sp.]
MFIQYRNSVKQIALPMLAILFLSNCANTKTQQTTNNENVSTKTVIVEAENFIENSGNVTIEKDGFVKTNDISTWLSYKIDIPVSGRYNVRLFAKNEEVKEANCWLEDYIDNKDGRTYNITSTMIVAGNSSNSFVQKDGSPLEAKTHLMKLHVEKSALLIDKIEFVLVREHKASPVIIKQNTTGKEWKLTWSDEFNGKGLPDQTKWMYDIGNWGWGNNEPQYYTENRVENARQEDGNLIIEARKNDDGKPWTSARLTTRGKESFLFGKIEFRAKVPAGQGAWSAGWLLGDSYVDELSWPYCGEVDVLENVGSEIDNVTGNGKTHGSVHYDGYYFKKGNQIPFITDVKNMNGEFHNYTLEWLPTGMTMYIDGVKYFDYQVNDERGLTWPYSKIPQNLILNLAIGGGMGGDIDPQLTSQKLIFDYVRVYELK